MEPIFSGGVPSPPLFCVQTTGGDEPKPWPYRSTIKVRYLEDVHSFVRPILESTLVDWLKYLTAKEITIEWVQSGNSDVRFGMTSGTTTCALGADAKSIPQDKPTAVLGLKKWEAGVCEVVWNTVEIERMARHLWGHVLGLPHAYSKTEDWNQDNLEKICNSVGIDKSQICNLNGCPKLDAENSIMHFDRPENIVTKQTLYFSNATVDDTSTKLLILLYPRAKDADCFQVRARDCPNWKETISDQKEYELMYPVKVNGQHRICALNYLDIGTNGHCQALARYLPQADGKLKILIGAYEHNVQIIDLRAAYLSFNPGDYNVQSGYVDTAVAFKNNNWYTASPGEQFSKRIDFSRPFRSPQVTAFIFRFSIDKNSWPRMSVEPTNIDSNGFSLSLNTWSDSKVYNISAYWVAHEADDPTIRSGRFAPPRHIPWAIEDRGTLNFSPPFIGQPRFVFTGINHMNVRNGPNTRVRVDAMGWTESTLDIRISTWEQESAYDSMGASWIALL